MPVLIVTCSRDVEPSLLDRLGEVAASHLGVPASRVMAFHVPASARMGGVSDPVALVEVRCARCLELEARRELVKGVVAEIRRSLAIAETRIYVQIEPRDGLALWRSQDGEALHARPVA